MKRENRKPSDVALDDPQSAMLNALRDGLLPVEIFEGYGWRDQDGVLPAVREVIKDAAEGRITAGDRGDTDRMLNTLSDLTEAAREYQAYAWSDRGRVIPRMTAAMALGEAALSAEAPKP